MTEPGKALMIIRAAKYIQVSAERVRFSMAPHFGFVDTIKAFGELAEAVGRLGKALEDFYTATEKKGTN